MSSPPRKIRKTCFEGINRTPDGVIRFELADIATLQEECGEHSFEIEVGGILWRANVCRDTRFLGLCLESLNNQSSQWRMDVNAEYSIVHSDSNKSLVKTKNPKTIGNNKERIGVILIDWQELINNEKGFIEDGKITFQIRFWISNMKGIKILPRVDFTDSTDPSNDITLIIDGVKIYANKGILATYSLFFKSLFYGKIMENEKNEIELKDVDREAFIEMLHVLYPSRKKVTDDSAEFLLEFGDRFQIAPLIDLVEDFLTHTADFSDWDKLRLADKHKLFGLMELCLSKLTSTNNFKTLEKSPIYSDLSEETIRLIFNRLVTKLPNDLPLADSDSDSEFTMK